jgi:hypothetical protein
MENTALEMLSSHHTAAVQLLLTLPDAQTKKIGDVAMPNNSLMGVYGHAEVGRVWKLDLEDLGFFLGHDDVNHRYIRNGRPMGQLPFLALSILQPVRRLEGGTYFGVLPESGTWQEFLERRLWWHL